MSENNNKMTQAMHRRDFLKHSAEDVVASINHHHPRRGHRAGDC
ncbi:MULTISPECIES: hypothetical protein [Pseudomonas]|nr:MULTISPECIES: hypothetical protein [Pseudomonas]